MVFLLRTPHRRFDRVESAKKSEPPLCEKRRDSPARWSVNNWRLCVCVCVCVCVCCVIVTTNRTVVASDRRATCRCVCYDGVGRYRSRSDDTLSQKWKKKSIWICKSTYRWLFMDFVIAHGSGYNERGENCHFHGIISCTRAANINVGHETSSRGSALIGGKKEKWNIARKFFLEAVARYTHIQRLCYILNPQSPVKRKKKKWCKE